MATIRGDARTEVVPFQACGRVQKANGLPVAKAYRGAFRCGRARFAGQFGKRVALSGRLDFPPRGARTLSECTNTTHAGRQKRTPELSACQPSLRATYRIFIIELPPKMVNHLQPGECW